MALSTLRALAALAVAVGLSGCASIFNGTTQTVALTSVPEGAAVRVKNRAQETVHTGTTPSTVTLKRGAGYFKPEIYTVSYSKDGYAPAEATATGTVSGWYAGNIVFGGLIGLLAVDPITGGMYRLPDTVSATLQAPRGVAAPASPAAPAPAPVLAATVAAAPSPTPRPAESLGNGTSLHTVERLPEVQACAASPRASLVAKGPGFETYAVACQNGDALAIRCEFGNCRVLR